MGNRINIIFIHDGSTDRFRSRSFAHHYFFKSAVRFFLEHMFTSVIGYINKSGLKFHQRI